MAIDAIIHFCVHLHQAKVPVITEWQLGLLLLRLLVFQTLATVLASEQHPRDGLRKTKAWRPAPASIPSVTVLSQTLAAVPPGCSTPYEAPLF